MISIEKKIGYVFQDADLLKLALTHRSKGHLNNERLEFLGDAILNCTVAQILYERFPKAKEGELTRLRASLVNSRRLLEIAERFRFTDDIMVGLGERKSGSFLRESILADVVEALIGAIYLDTGLEAAQNRIKAWWEEALKNVSPSNTLKDPKTALQEWLQARSYPLPVYEVVQVLGPPHDQSFVVRGTLAILTEPFEALAPSKRIAEQMVAEKFLEVLNHAPK